MKNQLSVIIEKIKVIAITRKAIRENTPYHLIKSQLLAKFKSLGDPTPAYLFNFDSIYLEALEKENLTLPIWLCYKASLAQKLNPLSKS